MAVATTLALKKKLDAIQAYDNEFKKWTGRVEKIVRKYRDDQNNINSNNTVRFNILWSNVQTLTPATFAKLPKADVSRRFSDDDPVGRVAASILERALDFEIEHYSDYRAALHNCVQDRFLGGRGVAWVRYEPHTKPQDDVEITEDAEPLEEITHECAPTDYVHWKDFGHSVARTWEENTMVWRWVYMAEDAVVARFGQDIAAKLSFDTSPDVKNGKDSKVNDKARICELWDLDTMRVYWLAKECQDFLDEVDDPLGLHGFFPCGKPLYATLTSDTLVPVPDFMLYQDQAEELDILSDRIDGLVKALRVRGVFDASQPQLQRLLSEGDNNTMIPVEHWGAFSEKGALKGVMDFLPIEVLAATLLQCYQAQQQIKGQIYEITGISDIIRGETAASETATAQQIKGQYAGLRLRSMQEAVALFASEVLRLKAQIICQHYQPQTILAYAAADQMSPADQALIPQAMQLLKNEPLKTFRIQVASDSLVQLDETQQKQDRVEFLNAMANFLREAVTAGQQTPQLTPMLMAMLKFGVGAYKAAQPIEGAIDQALQALEQAAANPPPHPDQIKAQAAQAQQGAEAQAAQAVEGIRAQSALAVQQAKDNAAAQLEQQKQTHEAALKQQQLEAEHRFDSWLEELKTATAITVAAISAKASTEAAETAAEAKVTSDLNTPESEDA